MLDVIERETGLSAPATVADVGSGTGIFTRLLLERGHTVFAVEPNEPMRLAAEAALAGERRFRSVDGRAEATTLADASVDLVTAAQAFHWFDKDLARREWSRILRPPRWVTLLWNERVTESDAFGRAYDALLNEWGGAEYQRVRGSWAVGDNLDRFFGASRWDVHVIPNRQTLDLAGLQRRLLSSSYLPGPDHPNREPMLAAARAMFEEHERGGRVTMEYETRVYVGRL